MKIFLVAKLDKIFSEYIRLRDSDKNGYVICISCNRLEYWKDVDCGHYINRRHLATRWHEKNCNAQCRSCNRFDEGNTAGYTLGLIKKYGKDIIKELLFIKNNCHKITDFEGKELIKYYTKKIKELKATKNLTR